MREPEPLQSEQTLPRVINEASELYRTRIQIGHTKTCDCAPGHLNCLTAKEWLKAQLGVWQCSYESRDIRDKNVHPATFPLALARRVIEWILMHVQATTMGPSSG